MEKTIIDKIWQEEIKRFGLETENIYWRHGYAYDGLYPTYITYFDDSMRVTIAEDNRTERAVRKDIRHELNHAFCKKNGVPDSELRCILAHYFPDFVIRKQKKMLEDKLQNSV